jgi:hypothetical protein
LSTEDKRRLWNDRKGTLVNGASGSPHFRGRIGTPPTSSAPQGDRRGGLRDEGRWSGEMKKDELIFHMGAMVEFHRDGSGYRGRLIGVSGIGNDVEGVNVFVELPNTRLRLSLPLHDVTLAEPGTATDGRRS